MSRTQKLTIVCIAAEAAMWQACGRASLQWSSRPWIQLQCSSPEWMFSMAIWKP